MTDPRRIAASIDTLYPEISRRGIDLSVAEDPINGDWLVTMRHDDRSLSTHLDKDDADACVAVGACAAVGVQIGRFLENYCLSRGVCPA
ncbi:hypothetical protein [Solidesulfovibrio sp.]|uniref:hypothetical protein n=1 Tax=Solidesulfovibrio sp. TaxID=2910990 RepID=UPI00261D7093|nr:hypothetical protein [Solidesulfovibrio sp.]